MAKVENLDRLCVLKDLYKDLCRTQDEEVQRVEIKVPSGTIILPKDMYNDIVHLCSDKLGMLIDEIEKL